MASEDSVEGAQSFFLLSLRMACRYPILVSVDSRNVLGIGSH